MNKYKIGQKVPREGKTSLVVFECHQGGRYIARTMRTAFHETAIQSDDPQPGQKVRLASGKEIVLVSLRPTGYWDNAHDDRIELSEEYIDSALADQNAREVYTSVATRRERGGNSRNLHFLPRRTGIREID